jgi:hypothetical protein
VHYNTARELDGRIVPHTKTRFCPPGQVHTKPKSRAGFATLTLKGQNDAMGTSRITQESFTGSYWVLVHSDRKDNMSRNFGRPVPPIDLGFGMLVFSSLENAIFAAKEQFRLYGIACRPQLLIPPTTSTENHCNTD